MQDFGLHKDFLVQSELAFLNQELYSEKLWKIKEAEIKLPDIPAKRPHQIPNIPPLPKRELQGDICGDLQCLLGDHGQGVLQEFQDLPENDE